LLCNPSAAKEVKKYKKKRGNNVVRRDSEDRSVQPSRSHMMPHVAKKMGFLALVVAASALTPCQLRAGPLTALDFGSVGSLTFDGGGNFSFTNATSGFFAGSSLFINGVHGGTGDAVGATGAINGTFTIGTVTTSGSTQSAVVTTTGSPNPATLTIKDPGSGTGVFTADIAFLSIQTDVVSGGTTGTVAGAGTINLSNLSYTGGTNADLTALASAQGGEASLTFRFTGDTTKNLGYLKSNQTSISFAGQLIPQAVPEPSSVLLAGMGVVFLGGGRFLRRRKLRSNLAA